MKQTVFFITLFRIVFAVLLVFTRPFSFLFYLLYILAVLSDIADGWLARKFGCQSKSGAALDSTADLFFATALLIIFIPIIPWQAWLLIWVVFIAFLRFVALMIFAFRFKRVVFLHTYSNKCTGFIIVLIPVFYHLLPFTILAVFTCFLASFACIEEVIISIKAQKPDADIKSFINL